MAAGRKMARQCHNDTCPVGIATQRADLRAKFPGKPEMVMAYMIQVAEQVREILAGLAQNGEMKIIGHTELLQQVVVGADAGNMDLLPLLWAPDTGNVRRNVDVLQPAAQQFAAGRPAHGRRAGRAPIVRIRGRDLRAERERWPGAARANIRPSISRTRSATSTAPWAASCRASWRSVTATRGCPPHHRGRAARQARAELRRLAAARLSLRLVGQANDYVGKGLAGGEIVIRPPEEAKYVWHHNVILGNTALYGATGGELYAAGRGRALRRAQLRPAGRGRGRGRSRLRVHDRRRGGRVGPDGPQLRRRDDGRRPWYVYDNHDMLTARANQQLVSLRRVERPEDAASSRRCSNAIWAHRQPARPRHPGRLGKPTSDLLAPSRRLNRSRRWKPRTKA